MQGKVFAVLVDGSNLYASSNALGFNVDFRKLLDYFQPIHRAAYFTAMKPKDEQSTLRPMVDYLEYNGWIVYQKETKEYLNPDTGMMKTKGNMDVEIAVVAMELAESVSDIVLVTGDGDFRALVEAIQRRGVRVTVLSTMVTRPPMIADVLRRQADVFIDLANLKKEIGRVAQSPVVLVEDASKARRFKFTRGE